LLAAVAIACLGLGAMAAGQDVAIPPRLQAQLVAKVAAYDAKFAARARGRALVLIVVAPGAGESERFSEQIRAELANQPRIGGLPHDEEIVPYTSAPDLARRVKERGAALVYITPSLSYAVSGIADALSGLDVLSVAAVPDDVRLRLVLGFALEAGRPKLVVNLSQARRQNVAFNPDLLRLARVIQ
jgi:phosphoserine phosphatase